MANRFLSNIRINDAYTFPASDGTSGQVIGTDGAGNLSFINIESEAGSTVIYKDNFSGDNSTVTFTLAHVVSDEVVTQVYMDGVYQNKDTYIVSGDQITFDSAPPTGVEIEVISFNTVSTQGIIAYNAKNSTGSTIAAGTAVMAVGTDGNSGHILISPMVADGSVEPKYFMGVTADEVLNGEYVDVVHFGVIGKINTSSFSDGDVLWLDPSNNGGFTVTEPNAPSIKMAAAIVLNSGTNGKIFVRVQGNEGLHELHDVHIENLANQDILVYNTTQGYWENSKTLGDINTSSIVANGTVDVNSNSLQLTGSTNPTVLVTDTTNNVSVGLKALDASTKIDSTHSFKIEIGQSIIQSVTSSGIEINGNITTSGTVDGVDISAFKSDYDTHTHTESEITDFGNYLTNVTHDTVNTKLVVTKRDGTTADLDLAQYIDDTNLARLTSGSLDAATGIATFTRDDATTFTVDFSALFDDTDTNDFLTGASFNTSDGVLTLNVSNQTDVTVDLDGRYLESYTETDTLATVTGRGAATTSDLETGRLTIANNVSTGGFNSFDDYQILLYKNGTSVSESYGIGIEGNTMMFNSDTTYKFYVDNAVKATIDSSGGLTLTGDISASGYNNSNWDTAYGWGDHSAAGYLTSFDITTQTDNKYLRSDTSDTMNGNLSVHGNILLTGDATTTNQGRLIDFTGFDKEGTTDFTDRAYIQHTTNTGGHSGSVLLISSQNDANDGIAFDTNSSSQLKHNGHTIWDAGNDGSGSGLDADLLDGMQPGSSTNNIAFLGSTRNLVINNPESYTGEVRLGAAWDYGGVYASSTLSMASSSDINFVINNAVYANITTDYFSHNGKIILGTFSQSQTNNGEAWIGRAADRAAGTMTVQLGTGTGRKFEVVDYNWTTVEFQVNDSGTAFAAGDFRAPIFYDSNNTGHYVNPAGDSYFSQITIANDTPIKFYGAGADTYTLSAIYCNSTNWVLEAPLKSNSGSGVHVPIYLTWRGGYSAQGGVKIDDGYTEISGATYSPIFYDSQDTNYYSDPNGLTRAKAINVGTNVLTGSTTYPLGVSNAQRYQIGFQNSSASENAYYPWLTHDDWNGSAAILHFNGIGDKFRFSRLGIGQADNDWRAPIFYDSNNTAYFVDANNRSYLNKITTTGINDTDVWEGYITVDGDANTYYPVGWYGGSQSQVCEIEIHRNYSDPAPSTWYTSTHKGGLVFRCSTNFGGWGGVSYDTQVQDFRETYSTMMGWMGHFANSRAFGFRLRGGGGRYYIRIKGRSVGPTVTYGTWDPGNNGTGLGTSTVVDTANIVRRRFASGSRLYSYDNLVLDHGSDHQTKSGILQSNSSLRAPIFYDSNDTGYYVNPNGITNLGGANDFPLRVLKSSGYNSGCVFFQNNSGDNSWGIVGEFRVGGGPGTDRPSIMFSHGFNNNTWSIGFGTANDDNFRIKTDHGHRNSSWGTDRMVLDRSGNVTFSGDVTAYSDERVKENVHTIPNALEITNKLRGVTYNRTDLEDKSEKIGVIAQEVQKILPQVVNEQEDGMLGVSYGNITALLIEAVKELSNKVEELENKLNGTN